jgi:hypothetical protein
MNSFEASSAGAMLQSLAVVLAIVPSTRHPGFAFRNRSCDDRAHRNGLVADVAGLGGGGSSHACRAA